MEILSRLAGPSHLHQIWDEMDVTDCGRIQEIIKTAFENGINMFDTAEDYQGGKSEEEM
jgi:aryl-alcohol dehydrogenase-like predicted oxidoreductase